MRTGVVDEHDTSIGRSLTTPLCLCLYGPGPKPDSADGCVSVIHTIIKGLQLHRSSLQLRRFQISYRMLNVSGRDTSLLTTRIGHA